ncbi:phosphoglycerate mutase-like protein [Mycena polygramma]|nr:phosphoglycerate mutase-like protein [Mycena polygramma]
MIETIYIARHGKDSKSVPLYLTRNAGFRMNWVNTNWKSETGLARDPPLAAFGVTQAHELAAYFLSLPEEQRPTAIFSSPYYRCLQTSQPVSKALGLPIYVEHGIRTQNAKFFDEYPSLSRYSPVAPNTGLHPRPGSAVSLRTYFEEIEPDAWASIFFPPRVGENVAQLHARAADFLDSFVPEVERARPGGQTHARILLVSHAATTIALARTLVGEPALPLRVGCCSLTEVVRKRDVIPILGGWDARRLADGAHLKEGSSREWGLEDIEVADGEVVADPGVPGTEHETDDLVGSQISITSSNL